MINQNKKLNLKEKDRRGKMVIAVLLLIAVIGVGYAALGANLKINGVANIPSASWDVHFKTGSVNVTNGSVSIDTNNNEQAATITNATQVNYAVKLALPGDFYEFTVVVENTGSIDAMIDSVSSKLGDTEITGGTLPIYLRYSVTYSDGVALATNHLLEAGSEETLKVRLEYNTDIGSSMLPNEATTLNFNFQVNYVQADDTAITKPLPPFTGIKYGVFSYDDPLALNSQKLSYTKLHDTVSDALADWTNPNVMNLDTEIPIFFKFQIESDNIRQIYFGFVISEEMAQETLGMVSGTYAFRQGGYDTSVLRDAFGSSNCVFYFNSTRCYGSNLEIYDVGTPVSAFVSYGSHQCTIDYTNLICYCS